MPDHALQFLSMRRWITILLLLVLPIQLAWGSVAPYCKHESKAQATKHFGHHDHRHQGGELPSPIAEDSGNGLGQYHPDCGICHLGAGATLPSAGIDIASLHHGAVHGNADSRYRSHVPYGPERPDRIDGSAAARFDGAVAFG